MFCLDCHKVIDELEQKFLVGEITNGRLITPAALPDCSLYQTFLMKDS